MTTQPAELKKLNRLRDALESAIDAHAQAITERDRLNEQIETLDQTIDSYQRQIRSMTTYD
jgi:predicted  nucleic acid-binding Zn-ribbon protein